MAQSNELSWKEIWGVLSKPFKITFSIATILSGAGIIGLITTLSIIANQLGKESISWNSANIIVLVVFAGLLFVGLGALTVASLVSLIRLKLNSSNLIENVRSFEGTCKTCSQSSLVFSSASESMKTFKEEVESLQTQVAKLHNYALAKYILDENGITHLERSVIGDARIVVMTSKFELDKGKLLKIILDNIRKGVKYEYLVPGIKNKGQILGTEHRDFEIVINGWWEGFKKDLFSDAENENCEFNNEYVQLCQQSKLAKNDNEKENVINKAWKYFAEHVKEYLIGPEHSLVTVIMYQQEPNPSKKWEVIIKLPTVTNDDYYAFQIPEEESREKINLIDGIEKICSQAPNIKLAQRS